MINFVRPVKEMYCQIKSNLKKYVLIVFLEVHCLHNEPIIFFAVCYVNVWGITVFLTVEHSSWNRFYTPLPTPSTPPPNLELGYFFLFYCGTQYMKPVPTPPPPPPHPHPLKISNWKFLIIFKTVLNPYPKLL